jgi:hypothetical protein
MKRAKTIAAALAVLAVASACGGAQRRPMGPPPPPSDLEQNIRVMLSYDTNGDRKVTRDEVEQALKRQFAVVDRNNDGVLDQQELQAENDRRYGAAGTGFSPLIDWNRDGRLDFTEFSTTTRSLFEEMDKDRNGVLEGSELRVPPVRRGGRGVVPFLAFGISLNARVFSNAPDLR